MSDLTKTETRILNFVRNTEPGPTLREIATHCGFKSSRAAGYHLEHMRDKGVLNFSPGKARSLRAVSPLERFRSRIVDIPLYGSIPAGFADERKQEAKGCVSIDVASVGIKPTARTFALEVRGDSMVGKHILNGDRVIVEHQTPRNGDVVVALIDGESTLKTFVAEKGKIFLKAENPRYPKLIPAQELVIQGVVMAVIRKLK